jgi:hypothetical protein
VAGEKVWGERLCGTTSQAPAFTSSSEIHVYFNKKFGLAKRKQDIEKAAAFFGQQL